MKIEYAIIVLIAILSTFLLITIFFDKPLESQTLFKDILNTLIGGFLGYLIRTITDDK
jgi:hypothetical protein